MSTSAGHAKRCMDLLDEKQLDITLLLALKHWDWLDSMRFGRSLKKFVECTAGLNRRDLKDPAFFSAVWDEFTRRGIVNLAPERRVEAYRKEELFEKYRKECEAGRWPEPHQPYLIQMRPGVFVLLSNFQAGFWLLRDMAKTRMYRREDGKSIPVQLLYEGQMEGEPCRCILDCEAYLSQFDGRLSREELLDSVQQVPQALVRDLVRIGAIKREDTVTFIEKNKCRGDKISFHYTTNLMGDPTVDMKHVLAKVYIEQYTVTRTILNKTKSMAHVPVSDGRCDPALHVDEKTIKGRHQFSVVFSRKEGEEPCTIDSIVTVTNGGETVERKDSPMKGVPLIPTHAHALDMLFFGGYTHWIKDTVVFNKEFRTGPGSVLDLHAPRPEVSVKKRGEGGAPPRASASSADPARNCSLPSWMKSVVATHISKGGSYAENTRMESLSQKGRSLSKYVPEIKLEDMMHVIGGVFCPVLTLYGTPRIHSSNGCYVAKMGQDRLYASCPNCSFERSLVKKQTLVETVPGTEQHVHPWVVFEEEGFQQVVEAASRTQTHPASKKAKTSLTAKPRAEHDED